MVPSDRLVDMFSFEPRLHSRVAVVPNAAPLFEPPMTARAPMRHEIRLVYLSNFIAAKGYAEVIRAVGILRHVHDLPVTCRLWESFSAMALRSAEPGRRSGALREDEPRRGRASQ